MLDSFETIVVEHADNASSIVLVTLRRPEVLNAINTQLARELRACLQQLKEDSAVRVIVLRGAGDKAFCAGADLKERRGMSVEAWSAHHAHLEDLADTLWQFPLPVLAAVEGYAFGGGAELAMLADFIVASSSASFSLPEATRGIMPGMGATQLLPRRIGAPLAKELFFTGRRFSAAEALEKGLVNRLVAEGAAVAEALQLAETIAANAPISLRHIKQAVRQGADVPMEAAFALERELYELTLHSEDRSEGINAFNEKRKPQFRGR